VLVRSEVGRYDTLGGVLAAERVQTSRRRCWSGARWSGVRLSAQAACGACTLRGGSSWVPLASAAEGAGPVRVGLILRSRPAVGVTLWGSVMSVLPRCSWGSDRSVLPRCLWVPPSSGPALVTVVGGANALSARPPKQRGTSEARAQRHRRRRGTAPARTPCGTRRAATAVWHRLCHRAGR